MELGEVELRILSALSRAGEGARNAREVGEVVGVPGPEAGEVLDNLSRHGYVWQTMAWFGSGGPPPEAEWIYALTERGAEVQPPR